MSKSSMERRRRPKKEHTASQVSVDAHIASGATQTLLFSIGDMLLGFRISVLLCHAKVNDMDDLMTVSYGPDAR